MTLHSFLCQILENLTFFLRFSWIRQLACYQYTWKFCQCQCSGHPWCHVVLCKEEILWPSKFGMGHEADTLPLLTFCCFKTLATGRPWPESRVKHQRKRNLFLNPFFHWQPHCLWVPKNDNTPTCGCSKCNSLKLAPRTTTVLTHQYIHMRIKILTLHFHFACTAEFNWVVRFTKQVCS
jgi:hypothetical protein